MGRIRQSKLAAIGKLVSNITLYLGIAIGTDVSRGDCAFIVSFIIRRLRIRRLRSALGFRAIDSRIRRSSVFSLATLTVVTILVLGIPVVGVAYISRLT